MAYNKEIESRINKIVASWENTDHKNMFGGICHLVNGNMFCGVYKDYLILRLGEDGAADLLNETFARPFDITGKAMKGWAMVSEDGFEEDTALELLLNRAKDFSNSLPPK